MQELLKNAWLGWQNYIDNGKLAALLLAALLFLWLGRKRKEQKVTVLLVYTSVMTACCIFPVTAAALMLYQTRFYDYEWIWSFVPVTLVIAYGLTEFLTDKRLYAGSRLKIPGFAALVFSVVFLCGNLGETVWDMDSEKKVKAETWEILLTLTDNGQNKNICLAAPDEIMEYARVMDGSIKLPYGRNMWDKALDGYSYDTYSQETVDVYNWLCNLEKTGTFDVETELIQDNPEKNEAGSRKRVIYGAECLKTLTEKGVNRLVLPSQTLPETLALIEEALGTQAEQLGKYYLIAI